MELNRAFKVYQSLPDLNREESERLKDLLEEKCKDEEISNLQVAMNIVLFSKSGSTIIELTKAIYIALNIGLKESNRLLNLIIERQ